MLRAEHISRRYFRNTGRSNFFFAVQETDFALPPSALTAVTGRSGGGKSTLLHMLAGLLTPTTGTVYLDETDLYALDDGTRSRLRNQRIGVIPQGQTGLHSLTVLENVTLPRRMYGDPMDPAEALALLEEAGIAHLRDAYPDELSGGEGRRLAIARALAASPEILLADEPTGDLDDESVRAVLRLLRRRADQGAAVLLVTHEREAADYADRVYQMRQGVLTPEG